LLQRDKHTPRPPFLATAIRSKQHDPRLGARHGTPWRRQQSGRWRGGWVGGDQRGSREKGNSAELFLHAVVAGGEAEWGDKGARPQQWQGWQGLHVFPSSSPPLPAKQDWIRHKKKKLGKETDSSRKSACPRDMSVIWAGATGSEGGCDGGPLRPRCPTPPPLCRSPPPPSAPAPRPRPHGVSPASPPAARPP
jgi:hypothetical protein